MQDSPIFDKETSRELANYQKYIAGELVVYNNHYAQIIKIIDTDPHCYASANGIVSFYDIYLLLDTGFQIVIDGDHFDDNVTKCKDKLIYSDIYEHRLAKEIDNLLLTI